MLQKEKTVENKNLYGIIEGVLFAMGDSVSLDKLAETTGADKDVLKTAIEELTEIYNNDESRGITIIRLDDSYQLCTKTDLYEYVRVMAEKRTRNSLSNAALEVLSIIAYNQPVTRSSIEYIRGVNSDGSLARLLEFGLVQEVGRLDAPGRPVLFGTTEEFLRCFALNDLTDLPKVEKTLSLDEMADRNQDQYAMDITGDGEEGKLYIHPTGDETEVPEYDEEEEF